MTESDRIYAIALALTDRVGWKSIQRLLAHFGSLDAIQAATEADLRAVRGIGAQIAANILRIDAVALARQFAQFEAEGIHALTWLDDDYPAALQALDDRPPVLFLKGSVSLPDYRRCIAIVGTREPSEASQQLTRDWAAAFARQGWTVVSGLARGVDTLAHRTVLDEHAQTVAVIGCGIKIIYPPENRSLLDRLLTSGLVLSEVHPQTGVTPPALRLRNRLITALSRATVIIEAGPTSGALHSARYASLQGRPVFAIPNSAGNIALLESGAARPLPDSASQISSVLAHLAGDD